MQVIFVNNFFFY